MAKTVYCACGCRQRLSPEDKLGRPRRFVYGHNPRKTKRNQEIARLRIVVGLTTHEIANKVGLSERIVSRALHSSNIRPGYGRYKRRLFALTCATCGEEYTVKRRVGDECRRCLTRRHHTAGSFRRRTGLSPEESIAILAVVLARDGRVCHFCRKTELELDEIHFDHMTPISRGGQHVIDNICVACKTCNLRKGSKTAEEFIAYLLEHPTIKRKREGRNSARCIVCGEALVVASTGSLPKWCKTCFAKRHLLRQRERYAKRKVVKEVEDS